MAEKMAGKMNILVLGGGGREHSLCWKIAQSPLLDTLYCAPSNGGIAALAQTAALNIENGADVVAFCREKAIQLVIIGPEAPLVAGVADALETANIAAFGPSALAAQLEGSKGFTKDICAEYNIPTAAYGRFQTAAEAHDYLATHPAPIVVKADGLAAGKGVTIAQTDQQAHDAVDMIFATHLGASENAGVSLVIEEFMTGEEASFFVLCDGINALPLATAQDHKRVGEGDIGANTGGMGAYSPAPIMTPHLIAETLEKIIAPTIKAMTEKGHPYKGVLYAGIMLTPDGPKLVEYNARFGDPECQVLMMRLKSDIVPALMATARGDLSGFLSSDGSNTLDWSDETALSVVMAAQGYPQAYEKNTQIKNIAAAEQTGAVVFHAGTKAEGEKILAIGGRVLNVTACGKNVSDAQQKAYAAIDKIDWAGGFYRRDIGWREIKREQS